LFEAAQNEPDTDASSLSCPPCNRGISIPPFGCISTSGYLVNFTRHSPDARNHYPSLAVMQDDATVEMTQRRGSRRAADIETDYQPVNWKRVFLAPKYLGRCTAVTALEDQLDSEG
jgi:hypothetical protein